MEKKNLSYAAPQVEVIAVELEQVMLNGSQLEDWTQDNE